MEKKLRFSNASEKGRLFDIMTGSSFLYSVFSQLIDRSRRSIETDMESLLFIYYSIEKLTQKTDPF